MADDRRPLEGITVIDLTRALAGPFCTLVLAGLGAEVIKVEDPAGGDVARGNAPYLGDDGLTMQRRNEDDLSLALLNRCRGKRSMTLNLKHPEAPAVFADLVASADVVVENFSSGTADRLGVGFSAAQAANPDIVYCSLSGFGAGGEPGARAMDTLIQALSGVMLTSGAPEEPPVRVGVPMADVITPLWAVIGILAALQRRQAGAGGAFVDVSMLGALTSLVATEDWEALAELGQPLRTGPTLPRLAPFGLYQCRDGWMALVAPQDKMVAPVFDVIGRSELSTDPRFATRDGRVRHERELTAEIEGWSRRYDTDDAVSQLLAAGVAAAPVRSPLEAVNDPRVVERQETVDVLHPTLGAVPRYKTAGLPLRIGAVSLEPDGPAPRLGQHTDEVLGRLGGYAAERVEQLRARGIV